jgi:hypothetical protein
MTQVERWNEMPIILFDAPVSFFEEGFIYSNKNKKGGGRSALLRW